ncbi:MAG: hypothetical protein A4E28_01767 [Methanocella sp. PtaU1.Bin125]|nr:MAG: hypothetical protein A4E28_01767 [Methanocella sp. PtaU1.Bin125]
MKRWTRDERAVSETLGYIIIFGVVVSGIVMVFLIGSQIIDSTQESASFQSIEQSFNVIGSDIRSTAFQESPMMTTRIKVDYGSLGMLPDNRSGSRVIISDSSGNVINDTPLGILTFNSAVYGKSIALENGALVKKYDANGSYSSIMSLQPRIFYSNSTKTLMVTLINLKGDYSAYSGGVDNIQSQYLDSGISSQVLATPVVRFNVRTNYTGAWNDYFMNALPYASKNLDTTGDISQWTNITISFDKYPDGSPDSRPLELMIITYDIGIRI